MKSLKPTKIPNRIKTVNDLLTPSNIAKVFDEALDKKDNMTDLVVIYRTRDGFVTINYSTDDSVRVLGLLSYAKHLYMKPDEVE